MIRTSYIVLAVLVGFLSACKTYSEEELDQFDERIQSHVAKKGLDMTKSPSGLYYHIDTVGSGEFIKFRDSVRFTYKGTFLNGTVFDHQKEPIQFRVDQLIGAWKEIMLELKEGGKATLIAPPQLAYGEHKLDDIPASSILVYEIEVVEVK